MVNTVLVRCAPEVVLDAVDPEEYFIQVPLRANRWPLFAQPCSIESTELVAPLPDRLVGQLNASLGHQLLDIAVTEGEAQVEPHAALYHRSGTGAGSRSLGCSPPQLLTTVIRMLNIDPVWCERRIRKVLEICVMMTSQRPTIAAARTWRSSEIGQLKGRDQDFVAAGEAIARAAVHEVARTLKLCSIALRRVAEQGLDPFAMNLRRPPGFE